MAPSKKRWSFKAPKAKKNKKTFTIVFLLIGTIALLIFFFIILFNYLFPPTPMNKEKAKDTMEVALFFPDADEKFLLLEKRRVTKHDNQDAQAKEIVKALLNGPAVGNVRSFPKGVEVQSVKIGSDGTTAVSFNSGLIKKHPGGTTAELMTVFSLVDTLIKNNEKIKRVKLLIDGKPIATLKGHIDISAPLSYREMQAKGGR